MEGSLREPPAPRLTGVLGLATGMTKPKYNTSQKFHNFIETVKDSRCAIIKYVIGMLIVTILLFLIKRNVFKISRESPIMSDLLLTFAIVGVTLGLKAGVATGLALFAPFKCPTREEQMMARGWVQQEQKK